MYDSKIDSLWRRFDYALLGVTVVLIIIGILMIRSATLDAVDPDLISRVPDQIRYAIIGIVVMFAFAALDYRLLSGLSNWLYVIQVALGVLVLLLGVEGEAGARSWIDVGIRIQPSEIGKVLIIITLGTYLAKKYASIGSLRTLLMSLLHVALPTFFIFIQPDLGTTIVFIVIWFTLVWAAGLKLWHIGMLVLAVIIATPVAWTQMQEYQKERITTFISPDPDDPSFYNIRQVLISIGSGGVFGKGYANGPQNVGRFLRVRHTDFIFGVIAEEFGMVGGVTVIVLIGFATMRILRGARNAIDPLGSLICYGVASMIFFQTFVSIGMNLNMLPVTGLTLPFVSSGGTSLLSTLAGIGLAESVIMRRRRI